MRRGIVKVRLLSLIIPGSSQICKVLLLSVGECNLVILLARLQLHKSARIEPHLQSTVLEYVALTL